MDLHTVVLGISVTHIFFASRKGGTYKCNNPRFKNLLKQSPKNLNMHFLYNSYNPASTNNSE